MKCTYQFRCEEPNQHPFDFSPELRHNSTMFWDVKMYRRPDAEGNRDYATGQDRVCAPIPGFSAPVERLVRVWVAVGIEHGVSL